MMKALVKEKIRKRGARARFSYESFCGYGKKGGSLHAETLWNCDFREGVLQPALTYQPFSLLGDTDERGTALDKKNIRNLFYFQYRDKDEAQTKKDVLFLVTEQGDWYEYEFANKASAFRSHTGIITGGVATFDREGSTAFVLGGTEWAYYYPLGDDWYNVVTLRKPSLVCGCQGRVFLGLQKGKIVFSEPDTPWDVNIENDSAEYILLPMDYGEISAMVAWENEVYVFLEYGIMRLTPDGTLKGFRLENLPYGGGKILLNGAGLCGNKIFFLAADGMYAFDGKEAKRICKDLPVLPMEEGQCCMSAVSGRKFLIRYNDRIKGDTMLIVLDGEEERGCFADGLKGMNGNGASTLFYIEEEGVTRLKKLTEHGEVFGESFFKSEALTFGKKERKTLERLYFKGRGSFICRIRNENHVVERKVNMENGEAEISVYERGKSFRLEFVFHEDACISYVGADVSWKV